MILDIPVDRAERLIVLADGGLNLRDGPAGNRLTAFFDGSFLTRTSAPVTGADGFLWVPVRGTDVNDTPVSGFVRIDFVAAYDPALGDMDATGRINPTLEAQGIAEVKVQAGDTLSGIAASLGVDAAALIAVNADHILDPNLIFPGDTVYLPDAAPPDPGDGGDRDAPPPNDPDDPVRPGDPGTPDLPADCRPPAPWDIRSSGFDVNPATGRCESTATVFVGRTDGYRSLFSMSQGLVYFTDDEIFGDDVRFFADVGGINRSLFVGDIRIDAGTGIGTVNERATGLFKLGGADVEFRRIEVERDRLLADVDFRLPSAFGGGTFSPTSPLVFGPTGLRFQGSNRFDIPTGLVNEFLGIRGLPVELDGFSARFLTGSANAFLLQGRGRLELLPGSEVVLDFRGQNGIRLNADGSFDVATEIKGTLAAPLRLKGGFGLRELDFEVNPVANTVEFGAVLSVPRLGTVEAIVGLQLIPGGNPQPNSIGIGVRDLNKPFVFGLFWQDVSGKLTNFAPANPDPVTLELAGRFTFGPEGPGNANALELETEKIQFIFDGGLPTVAGLANVGLFQVGDRPFLNIAGQFGGSREDGIEFAGRVTSLGDVVRGSFGFSADTGGNVTGFAEVDAGIPEVLLDLIREIPGGSLIARGIDLLPRIQAEAALQFINDGRSFNDFFALSFDIDLPIPFVPDIEFAIKFTRGNELFGLVDVDFYQGISALDLIGSWDVPDGLPWVLLNAEWDVPAEDVELRVFLPGVDQPITEVDFAANGIVLVQDFSTPTLRTVLIENPVAGIYDIELVDANGPVENVRYFARVDSVGPSLSFDRVTENPDGTITIDYTALDPDSTAEISFWYDDDLGVFDGAYIGSATEADGPGQVVWDGVTVRPGDYFLYAVVSDGSGPVLIETFEDFAISTGTLADLSVVLEGPVSVEPGADLPVTLVARNMDAETARNVTLVLELAGSVAVSGELPPGATIADGVLRIPLGDLAGGAEIPLDLTFVTNADTTDRELGITASLEADNPVRDFLSPASALIVPFGRDDAPPPDTEPLGAISGKYFVDANANGVDDAEPGVQNVEVSLFSALAPGTVMATTRTDVFGFYRFADVEDGTYAVRFNDQVSDRVLIEPDQGSNDTRDSDAIDLGGGMSQITGITVANGASVGDNDAGVRGASLAGRVFLDADRDGRDTDEADPGIGGVIVELLDAEGSVVGAPAVSSTSDGRYRFDDLAAGTYSIRLTDNAGTLVLGVPGIGPDDTDSDADLADTPNVYLIEEVEVGLGGISVDNDLGLLDPADFARVLFGTDSGDTLYAKEGRTLVHALDGNDRIWTGHADDMISAGDGDDHVWSGHGADIVSAGAGDDLISLGTGDDVLVAGSGDDRAYGGWGDDLLEMGPGHDRGHAGSGDDTIDAGAGDDVLFGDRGDDRLFGGVGDDLLFGSSGDDTLAGGTGKDHHFGGRGRDVFVFAPGDGVDEIHDFDRYDRSDNGHGWGWGWGWGWFWGWGWSWENHRHPDQGDRIDLSAFGFADFSELAPLIRAEDRHHSRIDLGNGDLLIVGENARHLSEDDFIL